MYSFTNLEPVRCSMSGSNCCSLTCIQISQEAGKMVWYSHLFKSFPQFVMLHTIKGISIVDETDVDVLLELSSFLYDPVSVGILFSGSSSFSKPSLNIWKFLAPIMLKPSMQGFKHDLTSMEGFPGDSDSKESPCNVKRPEFNPWVGKIS